MAEYNKKNWKIPRSGSQSYIEGNVVRKPRFDEDPQIEYGHAGLGEAGRERRRNREFAQAVNRRYIVFLLASATLVFLSAAMYLTQILRTNASKDKIRELEAKVAEMRTDNDETQGRLESSVDVEEIRRIAMEELGMIRAGQEQIVNYSYEESDYVRQYEDIPR